MVKNLTCMSEFLVAAQDVFTFVLSIGVYFEVSFAK